MDYIRFFADYISMDVDSPRHVTDDMWCPFCKADGQDTIFRCKESDHDWVNDRWWRVHGQPPTVTTIELTTP